MAERVHSAHILLNKNTRLRTIEQDQLLCVVRESLYGGVRGKTTVFWISHF